VRLCRYARILVNVDRQLGALGWAATAVTVIAFDAWAIRTRRETMSAAFRRGLRHRKARWCVLGAWTYITAHLLGWAPLWKDYEK
jgi:hypothetical protein